MPEPRQIWRQSRYTRRGPILRVVVLTLSVAGIMLYSSFSGRGIVVRYAPLVDAAMEIMLETAVAHLLFEEIIRGDRSVSIEEVWKHLDQAEWYARAMLGGGQSPEGKFVPLKDGVLRRDIEQTLENISDFKAIAHERWNAGVRSEFEHGFHRAYRAVLTSADKVETALKRSMERRLQRFSILQGLLIAIVVILGAVIGFSLQRHENRHAKDVQSLRDQEENARTTLNSIGDGVIVTNIQGNIVHMNQAAEHLTGWTVEEAQGKPLTESYNIFNARTKEPAENPVNKVLETGKIVGLANRTMLISRDGTEYQTADSAAPIRGVDGVVTGIVLVFRDVSKEYLMKEALGKSEQYLRSIFRAAPIGIGVTIDRVLNQVNDRLCEMTGYSEEELINQSSRILYPCDDDYEYVGRVKQDQIRDHGRGALETRWKRKDGRIIDILLWSTPIDTGNWSKGITFTALDITDRKQAVEAMRESEYRTRATFNTICDAVFLHPLLEEGFAPFVDVNDTACERYGYSREEFLALKAPDITKRVDADAHRTREHRKKLRDTGRLIFEATHITKSGEEFPVEINSTVVTLDGRLTILAVVRDITERKRLEEEKARLEEQYIQTQKMESIGRLAGGVAHDLNNLLTPVIAYGEMLLMDTAEDDPRKEPLAEVVNAGMRARGLVHQLLAFSRKQTLEYKQIDMNEVVKGFEKLLLRTIREDIEIRIIPSLHILPVMADIGQIEQVIMNLAVNAADAMPEGGKLTIETTQVDLDAEYANTRQGAKPGAYVMLAVCDTGSGMDQETQSRIFEPFFSTKGQQGTGLGLSTVYGIVKQHGGNIWVYSEPGEGVTFKVYLPVSEKAYIEKETSKKTAPGLLGTEVILLVEDNEQVRNLTFAIVNQYGYKVLVAENGEEALSILDRNEGPLHLLLTDVVMPGMNGKELYTKAVEKHPGLKVIYMSGYTDKVIAHRGILEEGAAFIQKPFSVLDLTAKIREVLDQWDVA